MRRPPGPPLFPYTTLFRSDDAVEISIGLDRPRGGHHGPANGFPGGLPSGPRSEEHTSELQSRFELVCRLPLEKKNNACQPPPISPTVLTLSSAPSARAERF